MHDDATMRQRLYRGLAKRLHDFAACQALGSEGEIACNMAGDCLKWEADRIDTPGTLKAANDEADLLREAAPDLLFALKFFVENARRMNDGELPWYCGFAADAIERAEGQPSLYEE